MPVATEEIVPALPGTVQVQVVVDRPTTTRLVKIGVPAGPSVYTATLCGTFTLK